MNTDLGRWLADDGYSLEVDTRTIILSTTFNAKYYELAAWLEEMCKFSNPWHRKRRWQIEIGFKLLAIARGQPVKSFVEIK